MYRSIRSGFLTAIGIIATAQIAVAEVPAERAEVGRVIVSYGDLDLGNATDARLMLNRLEHAAYRACGGDPRWNPNYDVMSSKLTAAYKECRSDAVSRAVVAVDAPLLSQMFRGEDEQQLVRNAEASRR
jgi:UrcA family protein